MTSEVVRRDSRTKRRITKDSVRVLQGGPVPPNAEAPDHTAAHCVLGGQRVRASPSSGCHLPPDGFAACYWDPDSGAFGPNRPNASLTCSWPLSGPLRRRSPCVAPFLAQQLTILTRNMARLQLQGRLQLDEPVEYDITDEGKLSFALTNSTKQLLRRFRTSLDAAAYDMSDDTAHVVVWPPLPLSVTIKLQRVPSREPSKLAAALEGARMPTFIQGLWSQKQKGSETSAA